MKTIREVEGEGEEDFGDLENYLDQNMLDAKNDDHQEGDSTEFNDMKDWVGAGKSPKEKKMHGFDENLSEISGNDVEIVKDSDSMYSGGTAIKQMQGDSNSSFGSIKRMDESSLGGSSNNSSLVIRRIGSS